MSNVRFAVVSASPPHTRGRGLKFRWGYPHHAVPFVAPSHEGAWIEIALWLIVFVFVAVAPSHEGAWIEIFARRAILRTGPVAPSHEGAWIEITLA